MSAAGYRFYIRAAHGKLCLSLNAVIAALHVERGVLEGYEAKLRVGIVSRADTVLGGFNGYMSRIYCEEVLAVNAVLGGVNGYAAILDAQGILADDAV